MDLIGISSPKIALTWQMIPVHIWRNSVGRPKMPLRSAMICQHEQMLGGDR